MKDKKELKTEQIHVKVSKTQKARIREKAASMGMTMSAFLLWLELDNNTMIGSERMKFGGAIKDGSKKILGEGGNDYFIPTGMLVRDFEKEFEIKIDSDPDKTIAELLTDRGYKSIGSML